MYVGNDCMHNDCRQNAYNISLDEMTVGKMSVNKMTLEKMPVDKMTLDEMACFPRDGIIEWLLTLFHFQNYVDAIKQIFASVHQLPLYCK